MLDEFNHHPHRDIQYINKSVLEIGELQSVYLTNEKQILLKIYKSEDILWVSNSQKER